MDLESLGDLARDRRLVTNELYPFNAFYGHASLLRRYAGIPGERPLKAIVEHGIALAPNPADPDLRAWLPHYLCASPTQASFFAANALHASRATAIGPLILYAQALEPAPDDGVRRLVYFDAHSSHYATAHYDVESSVAMLESVSRDFDETVVCLYWRDVLLGRAEAYAGRGYRCVTAGHMFDDRFAFRLSRILGSASVVLTDQVGTHVLYALALGVPVWLEEADVEYSLAAGAPAETLGPSRGDAVTERARAVLGGRSWSVEADQLAYAEELAGLSCFRSPAELAALLAEAEEAWRAGTPRVARARTRALARARRLRNGLPW